MIYDLNITTDPSLYTRDISEVDELKRKCHLGYTVIYDDVIYSVGDTVEIEVAITLMIPIEGVVICKKISYCIITDIEVYDNRNNDHITVYIDKDHCDEYIYIRDIISINKKRKRRNKI